MRKTILYAPVIYSWDRRFWPPSFGETGYYKWQVSLWGMFAGMMEYDFIWKADDTRTNNLIDPISKMKAKNIRYSTKPLGKELKK